MNRLENGRGVLHHEHKRNKAARIRFGLLCFALNTQNERIRRFFD